VFGVPVPQLTCKTLVPVGQQTAWACLYTKKLRGDPTVDRSVILVAGAEVAIEVGLTLPPGYYRAVKRQIAGPTPSKRQLTDPEYFIELSGRQIVAMGGSLGAAGLISADVDVTRQVREGLLRLSDRQPAPLARRAFAEYRSRDTFPGGPQKPHGRTWGRVRSDLAERFRKPLQEFEAAFLSFPSDLATKLRLLRRGRTSLVFTEQLRSLAVGPFRFFSSPISGAFNVYANNSASEMLRFWRASQLHVLTRIGTTHLLAVRSLRSHPDRSRTRH
jgi:hypothetical protein